MTSAKRGAEVARLGARQRVMRLLHAVGWRVTALCHLRASGVDLRPRRSAPHGRLRKNALIDKEGVDAWAPLGREAAEALGRLLRARGLAAGDRAFIFEAPRRPGRPWSRFFVRDLLERAERAAGIAHVGGLHAWRRKWATERKDYPEVDVMRAGDWKDPRSLRGAYTHADPETTLAVVSRRTRVVRRDDGAP